MGCPFVQCWFPNMALVCVCVTVPIFIFKWWTYAIENFQLWIFLAIMTGFCYCSSRDKTKEPRHNFPSKNSLFNEYLPSWTFKSKKFLGAKSIYTQFQDSRDNRYSNRYVVCDLRKSRCVRFLSQLFASWPLKLAELILQYKSISYSRQVISCVPSPLTIFPRQPALYNEGEWNSNCIAKDRNCGPELHFTHSYPISYSYAKL